MRFLSFRRLIFFIPLVAFFLPLGAAAQQSYAAADAKGQPGTGATEAASAPHDVPGIMPVAPVATPLARFTAADASIATIRIATAEGEVVKRALLPVEAGANAAPIPGLEDLRSGSYILTIIYPGGISRVEYTIKP